MSVEVNTEQRQLNILRAILAECEGSLMYLYGAINKDVEEIPQTTPDNLALLVVNLEHEIQAACAMANTIEDTSTGWPDEPDRVFAYTGPRSGYPVDLVTGLLCMAQSLIKMIGVAIRFSKQQRLIDDGTVNSALWGVHGLILEVVAVINYDSDTATADEEAKAA